MDEEALINAAQKGDLDSFNSLVLHYQNQVYNVAYRIMGEGDSAADATQEAFISAYKSIRRFRGGSFRGWLLRIVTNACYDELRRRKRRPATSLDDKAEWLEGSEDDEAGGLAYRPPGPERATQQFELAEALQECIRRLPLEFRTVAVLVDVQEMNYQEVAEVVGSPLGTIKSRVARARARLRECMQTFRELLPAKYRLEDEAIR